MWLWLLPAGALCAAPVPLTDSILSLSVSMFPSGASSPTLLLRADGTYVGLSNSVRVSTMPSSLANPPDTGTYTVSSGASPEEFALTFTNQSGVSTITQGRFESDNGGMFSTRTPWSWVVTTSFRVSARSEVHGASNVSNRSYLGPDSVLITGFIVSGRGARWALIRAAGPALRRFDVPNAAASATLDLYSGSTHIGHAGAWGAEPRLVQGIKALTEAAGAFPFDDGSGDSAMFVNLSAGAYTVHVRTGAGAGEVLCEVYLLPYSD